MFFLRYNYCGDIMGDVKKTTKKITPKKITKTSSVKKNINKEVVLSNEEILEQILNKKRNRVINKKSNLSAVNKKDENVKIRVKKTKQLNELENDFIYDQIMNKKKKKNSSGSKSEKSSKVVKSFNDIDDKKTIEELEKEYEILNNENLDIEKNVYDTYNSLEESVKAKKINKQDDFEDFITEIDNAQLLAEIKKALENDKVEYVKPEYEVSNKKAIDKIDFEINERLKNNINVGRKRKLKEKSKIVNKVEEKRKISKEKKINTEKEIKFNIKYIAFFLLSVLFVFVVIFVINFFKQINAEKINQKELTKINEKMEIEKKNKKAYDDCLTKAFDNSEITDEINSYINGLNIYFKDRYNLSVMYEDLAYGFTYIYNDEKDYYAASTIKSLAAMYVYEKAYNGEMNLDDTITYTSKLRRGSSLKMSKRKYGEKISLRELVNYSVTVSDNTAHNMLVKYIGVNELKKYGNEMGADLTHLNGDLFGYIDLDDAIIYMKKLNLLINSTGDYGKELESYFLGAAQNSLELTDYNIKAAHKYGEYEYVYHDIGIVYDKNPYVIAVLTHEGKKDYEHIIKDVNLKIYELHNLFYKNREKYCKDLVYGK